jgi:hypothetical protein
MKPRLACLLRSALLGLVSTIVSQQPAAAQSYPDKPVKLVVPFAAGGPADALGRILGEKLNQRWGQAVVIENRAGAGGNVGAAAVARAAPDGYTLLLNASSHVINASLTENLSYDPIRDFSAISEVASYMLVLVLHPSAPPTTLKEFVEFARSQPAGLTVANAGSGTPTHLAAVLFAQAAGLNFVHLAYRGAAPATNDVLAGHVLAMFNNPVNAVPQAKVNALRTGGDGIEAAVAAAGSADYRRAGLPGLRDADMVRIVRTSKHGPRAGLQDFRRHQMGASGARCRSQARGAGVGHSREFTCRVRTRAAVRAEQVVRSG